MKRRSGVLFHISSLWGDYSSGSIGKAAFEWIDFLKECGFSLWQTLPLCLPDRYNSPYKSFSAFSLNPYFIDLELLYEEGFLLKEELDIAKQNTPYRCEFERLKEERLPLLSKAAERFDDWESAERFFEEFPQVLNFCRFMAFKSKNGDKSWNEWDKEEFDEDLFKTWKFCQYTFFRQWMAIKEYANKNGIEIIGDIPIYVDFDSSDVWSNPECFQLDKNDNPTFVAAVPPDYFSPDGQLWGNPLYRWDKMREDGYSWWLERMRLMLKLFDGVRLDHFRAFESYYRVRAGEETARVGEWKKGPGIDFINVIKEACGDRLIIAEDLGDIDDNVRALVDESGLPGMRVLQFGFLGDENSPHLPHNYKNLCVAYTGTHDNNTLLGYIRELDECQRKNLFNYCGYQGGDIEECYESIFKMMFESSAGILIIPLQDLLLYGSDSRINTPGKAEGNWSFRITKEELKKVDRQKLLKFNYIYGRL